MEKKNFLKAVQGIVKRIFSLSKVHSSIRKTFHYYFPKTFKNCAYMYVYENQIVILAVFLMISSSFMKEKKTEKKLDFDWKSYLNVFKKDHWKGFLLCSARYLIDSKWIIIEETRLQKSIPELKLNFLQQYMYSLVDKNIRKISNKINLDNYLELLELVLKISFIYCYRIQHDSYKVLELVDYTMKWKNKMFEMFRHKAEYMTFSFFVNLSK